MRITEPTTMLTDYVLAALGVWLGWRLVRSGRRAGESSRLLWGISFLGMAVAAAAGGTVHGFAAYLEGLPGEMLWSLTTFFVGLASTAMLLAAVVARLVGAARVALVCLVLVKHAIYLAWTFVHDDFRYVIYDYASSMLVLVLLLAWPGRRGPLAGAGWVAGGVAVSFVAAAVQQSGFALHEHFNHNDLYHLIQMGGLYLLYRGGLLLRERRSVGGHRAVTPGSATS